MIAPDILFCKYTKVTFLFSFLDAKHSSKTSGKKLTARKQQNKAILVGFNTSILLSKILFSYQNGNITAKMLIRRSYLTLGVTIGVMLLIRECSTGIIINRHLINLRKIIGGGGGMQRRQYWF